MYFLVCDFSSFHLNNFRNTISWECFVKNDSVRPCLIELQSFLQSKVDVDPKYRVLMSLPCFLQVPCMTWCIQVDRIRILMILVHRVHRLKEYCLSVVQILTSRYPSCPVPSWLLATRLGFGIGWFDCELLDCCTTSHCGR